MIHVIEIYLEKIKLRKEEISLLRLRWNIWNNFPSQRKL